MRLTMGVVYKSEDYGGSCDAIYRGRYVELVTRTTQVDDPDPVLALCQVQVKISKYPIFLPSRSKIQFLVTAFHLMDTGILCYYW